MAGRIERALEAGLRIRPGEQRRVALMALYAANAIGAVVVGRSVRDALYLSNRPARGLAGMYIWSSIAIVLISWLYARVADRMRRGLLNALSALGCAALGAAFWAMLTVTDAVWVYAGLYVFVEAMGSLVVIQFWTLANDVFHAREAKRLFGLIGGGGTLANVIFGLLIGRYAQVFGAQNLLLLMVAQLILCATLAQAGSRLASPSPLPLRSRPVRKARVLSRAGLSFLSQRHLTIVALIGAVSAAAVTIVDFQFKLSAAAVLDENDLAGYFGRFYGICGGVALAVQIWVTGRVLERYGIAFPPRRRALPSRSRLPGSSSARSRKARIPSSATPSTTPRCSSCTCRCSRMSAGVRKRSSTASSSPARWPAPGRSCCSTSTRVEAAAR